MKIEINKLMKKLIIIFLVIIIIVIIGGGVWYVVFNKPIEDQFKDWKTFDTASTSFSIYDYLSDLNDRFTFKYPDSWDFSGSSVFPAGEVLTEDKEMQFSPLIQCNTETGYNTYFGYFCHEGDGIIGTKEYCNRLIDPENEQILSENYTSLNDYHTYFIEYKSTFGTYKMTCTTNNYRDFIVITFPTDNNWLGVFNQILSTFKFIDETGNWKTWKNEGYGYEIEYPAQNWEARGGYDFYHIGNGGAFVEIVLADKNINMSLDDWFKKQYDYYSNTDPHSIYTEVYNPNNITDYNFNGIIAKKTGPIGSLYSKISLFFKKGTNILYLTYTDSNPNDNDFALKIPILNQILSTFKFIEPSSANCIDECGDGVCQEIVCEAIGCTCAETKTTCPQDCK